MTTQDGAGACGHSVVIVGLSVVCAVLLGPRWWIVPAIYALGAGVNLLIELGKRQS